jgi:tetratricopeptide (TPR) repeat protein
MSNCAAGSAADDQGGSDDCELSVGARVQLHSLLRTPQYNGVEGEVLEFDASAGRWRVPDGRGKVVGPQDPGSGRWGVKISDGRVLALKPENLTAARKAGHKRECAPGAALIPRATRDAARPAPRAQTGPTKEQLRLGTRLNELEAADNWLGIVALEREALALARDLRGGHPGVAGAIHGTLGRGFMGVGQYARALPLHAEHKAMAEALGDRAGVAAACGNLGICYESTGEYARALALHAEQKAISEALGDRARVAAACGNLGNCYRSTGEYARALKMYAEYKAISEALGDRAGVAMASGGLGLCYHRTGEYARALPLHAET